MYSFFHKKNYKGKDIIFGSIIIVINLLIGVIYPGNILFNDIPELKNDIETFNDYLENLNNHPPDFNLHPAVEDEEDEEEEDEEEARRASEERRVKEEEKEEIISIVNKIKNLCEATEFRTILIGIALFVLLLLGSKYADSISDLRNAQGDGRP